jgi:hypothetical protein
VASRPGCSSPSSKPRRHASGELELSLRFHPPPLSDLYLVYNDRRDTTSGQLVERALILKLTNLFGF